MDDDCVFPFFLLIVVSFLLTAGVAFTPGETKGRKEAIIYCMEKPDKCKIEYNYLKLENSK